MAGVINVEGVDFKGLNDRQRLFCIEYAVDLNGARAAREAGYAEDRAPVTASMLLKNAKVKKVIEQLLKPALKAATLDKEQLLKQIENFVYADIAQYFNADGALVVPPCDLPPKLRQCITKVRAKTSYDRDGNISDVVWEVELVDKLGASNMAMKYNGAYAPEEHNVNLGFDWAKFYGEKDKPAQRGVVEAMLENLVSEDVKDE